MTTRPHTQHCGQFVNFWRKKCIPVLPQAPYSPNFSPCEFYLFPKLKSRFKIYHFQTLDSVQKAVTDAINTLTEADCQSRYEEWKIRWTKFAASEGYYFEWDNVHLDE
jgi:hypothetical protein